MREIKFRAWDNQKNKMLYNGYIAEKEGEGLQYLIIIIHQEENLRYLYANGDMQRPEFFHHKFELMQFTGLKDKNGEEIYEGDIIKQTDEILRVFFNDSTASFDVQFLGGDCENLYTSDFEEHKPEIIGNIYENPELLEEE